MSILFIVLPLAFVLAGIGVWAFMWAVKSGQYDDMDTPPYRAMFDDD
ncbi:MAG: cbb3-type cytochrome oxidase assembly protein CcoS [Planctomycetota bacterium]